MVVEVSSLGIFSKEELDFLEQWGTWLDALANGVIEPFTKEQNEFVEVCRGERETVKVWEKAWFKLQERLKIDAEYKNLHMNLSAMEHGQVAGGGVAGLRRVRSRSASRAAALASRIACCVAQAAWPSSLRVSFKRPAFNSPSPSMQSTLHAQRPTA